MTTTMKNGRRTRAIGPEVGNGGRAAIAAERPYSVEVTLQGVCDLLFHRYDPDSVAAKDGAKKGSAAKKTDDMESYVYRNNAGELCIPGENLRMALVAAAKYKQDPRSSRKTACDLVKAAIVPITQLASLGTQDWDYDHRCGASINRARITRCRPAMMPGWQATFVLMVNIPEYVSPDFLHSMLIDAGRLVGICDFRPTYGRFNCTKFEVLEQD